MTTTDRSDPGPDDRPDRSSDGVHDHDHDHDRGLAFDLHRLVERRGALKLFAGLGAVALVGCSTGGGSSRSASSRSSSTSSSTSTTTGPATTAATCTPIPGETGGPYPGDGTNGPDVLSRSGIVRSDIRPNLDGGSTAEGVPATVTLRVSDASNGCAPLAGGAVYLWHCDRDGGYSMYGDLTDDTFLRGVQPVADDGSLTFTTIFPAAYSGRWPHMHFEVYPSVADAAAGRAKITTSQLALPEDACNVVYATDGYEQSVRNLAQTSLDRDMVFSDGTEYQMATVEGSVASGYAIDLAFAV